MCEVGGRGVEELSDSAYKTRVTRQFGAGAALNFGVAGSGSRNCALGSLCRAAFWASHPSPGCQCQSGWSSGDARAGARRGAELGRPRCSSMARTMCGASMVANRRILPPQRSHASTSMPKARRMRSAQFIRRRAQRDRGAVSSSLASARAVAGLRNATARARHLALGAKTP